MNRCWFRAELSGCYRRDDRPVTDTPYRASRRTVPTRNRQRVGYDRDLVHAVLDEAFVCHVGFVVDGAPVVLPQLYVRVDEVLYLHGSTGARAMMTADGGNGLEVCVTVTLLDGLVLARSAFHHSVNYRSVVIHGLAELVEDETEKSRALTALVDGVVPGRSAGTRGPSRKELAATAVLRLPLAEVSVKRREGGPQDDPRDLGLPFWAGVLPLALTPGNPQPATDLDPGVPVPSQVGAWLADR